MSSARFVTSFPFVLRWEGGYINHPADPGGATNKGVTQATYDGWTKRHGLPQRSVKIITDEQVASIYESDYWLPPRCDLLGADLDLVQFDTAVNMGPVRAVRILQATLGCVVDGDFGGETLKVVHGCDPARAAADYCDGRETYYRSLAARKPSLLVFLKGWLNRLNSLRREIGLPGFESAEIVDFGDTGHIQRIPDIGLDPAFD